MNLTTTASTIGTVQATTHAPAARAATAPVTVATDGTFLRLRLPTEATARFHAIWLRHNTPDAITQLTTPAGRRHSIADLPTHCTITTANLRDNHLHVEFAPDGHHARYSIDWLARHVYDAVPTGVRGWVRPHHSDLTTSTDPTTYTATFDALLGDTDALLPWLEAVRTYGAGRVTGGPANPKALERLVNRFTTIHPTHRGRFFDATHRQLTEPDAPHPDCGTALTAHTEAPYRTAVPGLSIVYCLENTVTAGAYSIVDGFTAARRMRDQHGLRFDLLADYCVSFSYHRPGETVLTAKTPLLVIDPDGELTAVRLDQRYLEPLTDVPYPHLPNYLQAYQAFTDILTAPDLTVKVPLHPGDALILDNRRTLLTRDSFDPRSGTRRLQGCYASADGLASTIEVLRDQLHTVNDTPR